MTDAYIFVVAFVAVLGLCAYEHSLERIPYYAQTSPQRWKRRILKTGIGLLAVVALLSLPGSPASNDGYLPETDIPYSF